MEKHTDINPFLASFSIKPVITYTEWHIKGGDAPIGDSIRLPKPVDASKGSWYSNMVFSDLYKYSTAGLQILGYILDHLRWNQDYIQLKPSETWNPEDPYAFCMTKSKFYNGINELCSKGIIAKRAKRVNTYWINPSKFFAGNRLKCFADKVVMPNLSED